MATVKVKIQNPFKREYVVMDMPKDMRLADMQSVSDIATKMAAELCGSKKIPEFYCKFPINNVGRMALILIAQTMPDKLADSIEGVLLCAMISASSFIRQLLDRVGMKVMMDKKQYIQSIIDFCSRSTVYFVEALRLRLPVLVQQAHDTIPVDLDRARRLGKLVEIAIKTMDELPSVTDTVNEPAQADVSEQQIAAVVADSPRAAKEDVPAEQSESEESTDASDVVSEEVSDAEADVPASKKNLETKYGSSAEESEEEDVVAEKSKPKRKKPVTKALTKQPSPKPASDVEDDESDASDLTEADFGFEESDDEEDEDEDN